MNRLYQKIVIEYLKVLHFFYKLININFVLDGTLIISVLSKEDSGFYTCQASNAAGKTEVVIQLLVIMPPEIRKPEKTENINVEIFKSLSLSCPILSSLIPDVI